MFQFQQNKNFGILLNYNINKYINKQYRIHTFWNPKFSPTIVSNQNFILSFIIVDKVYQFFNNFLRLYLQDYTTVIWININNTLLSIYHIVLFINLLLYQNILLRFVYFLYAIGYLNPALQKVYVAFGITENVDYYNGLLSGTQLSQLGIFTIGAVIGVLIIPNLLNYFSRRCFWNSWIWNLINRCLEVLVMGRFIAACVFVELSLGYMTSLQEQPEIFTILFIYLFIMLPSAYLSVLYLFICRILGIIYIQYDFKTDTQQNTDLVILNQSFLLLHIFYIFYLDTFKYSIFSYFKSAYQLFNLCKLILRNFLYLDYFQFKFFYIMRIKYEQPLHFFFYIFFSFHELNFKQQNYKAIKIPSTQQSNNLSLIKKIRNSQYQICYSNQHYN